MIIVTSVCELLVYLPLPTTMVMDYCMGNNNESWYLWCAHLTYSGYYNNND